MSAKYTVEDGEKIIEERSKRIKEDDIKKVVKNEDKIMKKAHSGSLLKMLGDIRDMFCMVSDYWKRSYTEVPFGSIAAIVAALLYVLSPLDFIPDFLPIVGLIDDATAITACLSLVRLDIGKYRKWRAEQEQVKS